MAPPTAVLTQAPPEAPTPAAAPPGEGRRLPTWWPLAALGVLGVILLVTAVLAGGGGESPAAGPDKTASGTPSGRVSATADVHTIDPADYVGLDADEATTKLHALGYDDVKRTTRQGSADGKTGTVASMAPTGQVSVDEPITLTVWGVPEKSAPTGGDEKKGPGGGGHGKEGHGKGKNK
jgi:hypothetical protein